MKKHRVSHRKTHENSARGSNGDDSEPRAAKTAPGTPFRCRKVKTAVRNHRKSIGFCVATRLDVIGSLIPLEYMESNECNGNQWKTYRKNICLCIVIHVEIV